jgi:hypothetical protein
MFSKRLIYSLWGCLFLLGAPALAQPDGQRYDEPKADKFATVTVAVISSNRPYHVAFVKYFDKNGDILLNTSEEFKVDISKSPRFATGSIRKTIPLYKDAEYIEVRVSNCSNMHENQFFVNDFTKNGNEATFVFSGTVEDVVSIEFEGIADSKPCTFQVKGTNTNVIFYADYSNVKKLLPEEAKNKDITVEVSATSLYKYKVESVEKDKKGKKVLVKVSLPDDAEEATESSKRPTNKRSKE